MNTEKALVNNRMGGISSEKFGRILSALLKLATYVSDKRKGELRRSDDYRILQDYDKVLLGCGAREAVWKHVCQLAVWGLKKFPETTMEVVDNFVRLSTGGEIVRGVEVLPASLADYVASKAILFKPPVSAQLRVMVSNKKLSRAVREKCIEVILKRMVGGHWDKMVQKKILETYL
jgi:hypothetical protein